MAENTDSTNEIPAEEDDNQTPNEPQNNYPIPAVEDNKQTPNEPQNNYPIPAVEDNKQTPNEPQNNYPIPAVEDNNQTFDEAGNNYPASVQDDNTDSESDIRRTTELMRTLTPRSMRKVVTFIENLSKKGVDIPLAPKFKGIVPFQNKEENQVVIDQCTAAIKTINESPQGIAYPDSQITFGPKYVYEENKQYKIIGNFSEGNTADKVCKVQDLMTGRFHVMKIQDANNAVVGNELKAMDRLRETGIVPKLLHFHMENKQLYHMEIIEGITLDLLQQTHIDYLNKRNLPTEVTFGEVFTLCINYELFVALCAIHELGVAHSDIHGNNVMLELPSMRIKYLDWGAATFKEDTSDEEHFRKDIICTLSTGMGLWPDQKNEGRLAKQKIEDKVLKAYDQRETGIQAVLELLENIVTRNYTKETEFSEFLTKTMETAVTKMDLMSKMEKHQAKSERDPSTSTSSVFGSVFQKFVRTKIPFRDRNQ